MDVVLVLKESFNLLREKPKVFLPRILTTLLYSGVSLLSLWLVMSSLDVYSGAGVDWLQDKDPREVSGLLSQAAILLLITPLLYFIDILSYAMYPRIVSDYKAKREIDLRQALLDGLRAWKVVLAMVVLLMGVAFASSVLVVASFAVYIAFGQPVALALGAVVVVATLMFFLIIMFFVIPAAVLERKGIIDSFAESFKLGMRYRGPILRLNLVFLAMVLVTFTMVYLSKADELASAASIAVFIAVRLGEAVVYTYLSVSNPLAFIHIRVNNPQPK